MGQELVKFRADSFDFGDVDAGQGCEAGVAGLGEAKADAAAVGRIVVAGDVAGADEAVDQFDGTVVVEDQEGGKVGNGGAAVTLGVSDSEQGLVLAWRQPGFAGCRFAEGDEAA